MPSAVWMYMGMTTAMPMFTNRLSVMPTQTHVLAEPSDDNLARNGLFRMQADLVVKTGVG